MTVSYPLLGLRRYPVKSMAGEDLATARIDQRGITGDRWFAVRDENGHFASGKDTRRFRRHDEVFEYAATTIGDDVRVSHHDGSSWTIGDPALDAHLSTRMGQPVHIAAEDHVPHQDMGSVSIVGSATLRWCAQQWSIDADPRRLRVNLVIDTTEPFVEESWIGRDATVGTATLRIVQRIPRCRMIDIDQDGAQATGRWLKPLADERDMSIAVYADVVHAGHMHLEDRLTLL